jgi:hypothetical protein
LAGLGLRKPCACYSRLGPSAKGLPVSLTFSHGLLDLYDEGSPRERRTMVTKHMTGTRKEWLAARLDLLEAEKELTRRSDELARRRQELPWVRLDKQYRFDTDEGSASLADLFQGRSQLLVYLSCLGPTTRRAVRPARQSPTASTAPLSTWPITMSCFGRSRGRRSRSCGHISSGWAGPFPGPPPSAATLIPTSTSRSPSSSSAREAPNIITGPSRR